MFIKKIHIVQFKSIRELVVFPKISNVFADVHADVTRSDLMDAIRFVLDVDYTDPPEQCDQFNLDQVRLSIRFEEDEQLPALLINQNGRREFTATRYRCHSWTSVHIAFDGDQHDEQRSLSVADFHQLLYGSTPPQNLFGNTQTTGGDQLRRTMTWLAPNDADDTGDGGNSDQPPSNTNSDRFSLKQLSGELLQCSRLVSHFTVQLAADERLSLERRALRTLRTEQATDLLEQLQRIEDQLGDETAEQALQAVLLCSFDEATLQCQRNMFWMFGAVKRDDLFAQLDAIRSLLDTMKRPSDVSATAVVDDDEQAGVNALRQARHQLHIELAALDADSVTVHTVLHRLSAELLVSRCGAAEGSGLVAMESCIDRSGAFVRQMDEKLASIASTQALFGVAVADAHRQLDGIEVQVVQQRRQCADLQAKIAEGVDASLQHTASLHREHIEWLRYFTTDLHHRRFRAVFQPETLIGVTRLNELLDCDARLSADFVGYVIDFVRFRSEYVRLAAVVQHALCNVLLNGIFASKRALLLALAAPTFGQLRLWSLDTYRPNPLPLGLRDTAGLRPLSAFLQPASDGGGDVDDRVAHMVADMLDDFVVLDSDAYTLAEAARITRRNVICARSGRWTLYGSPYDAWPVAEVTAAAAETVFDVWKGSVNRRDHAAELLTTEQLLRGRRSMLDKDVIELQRERLHLERLHAERREQLLNLIHLQQNAFRNERIVHQVRLMRLEHELQLAACTAAIAAPVACTASMAQMCLELGPAQIAAMRSTAKLVKTCSEIQLYFESTSAAILAGQVADDGAADIRWLNECVRRVEAQRTDCAEEWQRTADDGNTVGGSATYRRMAEVRAQLAELNGRIELHTEAQSLRQRLRRARHEERQQSVADITLMDEFANMSNAEIERRQRGIDELVEPDAVLVRRRRRCTVFQRHLECGDAVLGVRQALLASDHRRRRRHLTSMLGVMRSLVPLMDRRAARMLPRLVMLVQVQGGLTGGAADVGGSAPAVQLVLRDDTNGGRIVHVGRNEQRCLALLWYLAGCVVRRECSVMLLGDLMQPFSAAEKVQIMNILRTADVFEGLQWFGVTDEATLTPFVAPAL